MLEILIPKYRRNPNAMVHSAYVGVAQGHRTLTRITAVNKDADRFEHQVSFGQGIPRGEGGRIATLVLGGMETTLDEIEYILEGIKEKKQLEPQRSQGDIAAMCQLVAERRNARIKYLRKNPSEAPRPKPKRGLYLPRGYRLVPTTEPGLRIAVKG